jgi:hypothetical protein
VSDISLNSSRQSPEFRRLDLITMTIAQLKQIVRLPRSQRAAALRFLIWEGPTQYNLRALGMLLGAASAPDD